MSRHGENIRKRSDGRWEARYIEQYESGKAKYRYVYAKTYPEVKAKRNLLMKTAIPHKEKMKADCTVMELSVLWLNDIRVTVKESTYSRYTRNIDKYILPRFGEKSLHKLDTHALVSFVSELSASGGKNGKPLSAKTVTDILCVLKSCLRYGRENSYACPDLSLVKQPKITRKEIEIIKFRNKQAMNNVLWNSGDNTSLGILLSLYTGLRIGELCALKWSDVDLSERTINISGTVERIKNTDPTKSARTKLVISEPKTETSRRTIPLPIALSDHLKKHKSDDELYLLNGTDKPTEPHTFYIRYKRYLKRHGLGDYTFHALRHTFATDCVEQGFDTKSLAEILGHNNISTTLCRYVHPTMEAKRKQMERLIPENIRGQNSGH